MNKMIVTTLLAGALLLLDAPEAAAHKQVRNHAQTTGYYAVEHRRAQQMPRWLKRNASFRHWYSHSRVKRDRRLGWRQVFDIYRWERSYKRRYRVNYTGRMQGNYRSGFTWDGLQSRQRKH